MLIEVFGGRNEVLSGAEGSRGMNYWRGNRVDSTYKHTARPRTPRSFFELPYGYCGPSIGAFTRSVLTLPVSLLKSP